MSSSSSHHISIFDIPLILDLICDNLTKDQLLVCLDVSRSWHILFSPQALRHVRFSNLKPYQTWSILNRASLVRSLTIDISDAGWFLNNSIPTTSLRELRCVDFNYLPKQKPMNRLIYTRPTIVDQAENALLLVGKSPKLHTLIIDGDITRHYRSDHFTEEVFKSIFTHQSLTKIKIHLGCAAYDFVTVLVNSLPSGIMDFELVVREWIPDRIRYPWHNPRTATFYPKEGFSWQPHKNRKIGELGNATLPQIERLTLGEISSRKRYLSQRAPDTLPAIIDSEDEMALEQYDPYHDYFYASNKIKMKAITPIVEKASRLRFLTIKGYSGSWLDLFDVLLDNCLEMETIDLQGCSYFDAYTHSSTVTHLFRGLFSVLREFRLDGVMSEQIYTIIAKLVVRSASTLERVQISRYSHDQTTEISNPFHIGTYTSWIHCTRLKELRLYNNGGIRITDHHWEYYPPYSVIETDENYSYALGQLKKLQLSLKEPLEQVYPDCCCVNTASSAYIDYDSWDSEDYYDCGYDRDEVDDIVWKPLKYSPHKEKEEKAQEEQRQLPIRRHQLNFIIYVRELFGRLKDLTRLEELEIEWTVCPNISDMSLEYALELFHKTEAKDISIDSTISEQIKSSKGWWGEVTADDLVWLCLPWSSQVEVQMPEIPSDIIRAAARQYENKTQLPSSDYHNEYNGKLPWSTGDIYNSRVGRTWKDWKDITNESHRFGEERCKECNTGNSAKCYEVNYKHVMYTQDFEKFVDGVLGKEEAVWGRKKATCGTALDIPLIMDLICDGLTRQDLLACVQASRRWLDAFKPQLDRFVRIDRNPRSDLQHIRSVVHRAARIRSLQIDISDGGWFLPSTAKIPETDNRCINLEHLSCLDFGYQPRPSNGEEGWFYHSPDRPSIVSQSNNALRLIAHSPKLRSLHIHHSRQFYRTDHFMPEVLQSLAEHKSLTQIKIWLEYAVDAEFRIQLLQHLPETIEEFELICRPTQVGMQRPVVENTFTAPLALKRLCLLSNIPQGASSSSSLSSSYWDNSNVVKEDFSEFRFLYPDTLIIPLLQHAPQLQKFAIAGYHGYPNVLLQTLAESCPDVEILHLGGTDNTLFHPSIRLPRDIPFFEDDDDIVPRDRTPLSGKLSLLKEFRTTGFSRGAWSDLSHEDVTGLLIQSSETLERVYIHSDDQLWEQPLPFSAGLRDMNKAWADCKHIKELAIEPLSRMDISFLDPTFTTTNHDGTSDTNIVNIIPNSINTNFVSLESLRLTSLADAYRTSCSNAFAYTQSCLKDPSLDDYIQLPNAQYDEWRHIHHNHQLQFIRRVRELFGRLKSVKTLKNLDLEWSDLCVVVKSMTEETVMGLLKETEIDSEKNRGSNDKLDNDSPSTNDNDTNLGKRPLAVSEHGWKGPMTLEDLAWLGLKWPTLAEIRTRDEQRQQRALRT
ncbi:hypothetical protein FBU30_002687 [Linnemannia zychae]|nr:hypothetical protein FBU30_002687 [Linnemannia zychae]